MEKMETIKPGMTRADLLKVFRAEGRLCWCRLHEKPSKFTHSKCPEVVPNVPRAWLSPIADWGIGLPLATDRDHTS